MKVEIQSNIEGLVGLLEQKQEGVNDKRQKAVRQLVAVLMNRVIARTPVDTGRARDGWSKGEEEQSGDVTKISMTNDVAYINFLEYGTSNQPARAMVRSSLSATQAEVGTIIDWAEIG